MDLSFDSPVMHETGIANRSPGDQHRSAADLVVDHLAYPHHAHRVGPGVAVDLEPHDELVRAQRSFIGRDENW